MKLKIYLLMGADKTSRLLKRTLERILESSAVIEVVHTALEADVIVSDYWFIPADPIRKYLFIGIGVLVAMRDQDVWDSHIALGTEYPVPLPNYDNAFYVQINIHEALRGLASQYTPVERDATPITVIVDDRPENLTSLDMPDSIVFTRAEAALSFIQVGTRAIKAILADLVMPLTMVNHHRTSFPAVQDEQASGLLVCLAATRRGIPVAVVTAGHSATPLDTYFIYHFAKSEGIPVIEVSSVKRPADWMRAYNCLFPIPTPAA